MVGGNNERSEDILCLHNLGYNGDANNMPAPGKTPPFNMGQSPPKCKGAYLRSGTDNTSSGVIVKVTDMKIPSLWILRNQII